MNDSLQDIYKQIWDDYRPEMKNHCHTKLRGHYEDAEDVLQRAFELLWAKMLRDGVPPVPQAWLHKTITNLINEEYRKYEKEKVCLSFGSMEATALPYTVDMEDALANEELRDELLKAAKEELSNEEKNIVHYAFFEGKSNQEIATLLGISETAAKQRKYRLLRKTRQISAQEKKKLNFF